MSLSGGETARGRPIRRGAAVPILPLEGSDPLEVAVANDVVDEAGWATGDSEALGSGAGPGLPEGARGSVARPGALPPTGPTISAGMVGDNCWVVAPAPRSGSSSSGALPVGMIWVLSVAWGHDARGSIATRPGAFAPTGGCDALVSDVTWPWAFGLALLSLPMAKVWSILQGESLVGEAANDEVLVGGAGNDEVLVTDCGLVLLCTAWAKGGVPGTPDLLPDDDCIVCLECLAPP